MKQKNKNIKRKNYYNTLQKSARATNRVEGLGKTEFYETDINFTQNYSNHKHTQPLIVTVIRHLKSHNSLKVFKHLVTTSRVLLLPFDTLLTSPYQ